MYPTNNNIFLKEIIEEDARSEVDRHRYDTGSTPVLYNPNAGNKLIRRYEIVDITSNILMGEKHSISGDIIEVGDEVAVRVKDVEEFFDGIVITEFDKVVAIKKKGKQ